VYRLSEDISHFVYHLSEDISNELSFVETAVKLNTVQVKE